VGSGCLVRVGSVHKLLLSAALNYIWHYSRKLVWLVFIKKWIIVRLAALMHNGGEMVCCVLCAEMAKLLYLHRV